MLNNRQTLSAVFAGERDIVLPRQGAQYSVDNQKTGDFGTHSKDPRLSYLPEDGHTLSAKFNKHL
jgi:hypothetical protein